MSGIDWGEDPEGATPLDEEQRAGLRLSWISSRAELNEAEADNILEARRKWRARARARGTRQLTLQQLLDHMTLRDLHRDMYGEVWSWAGQFRQRNLSIGIDYWKVPKRCRACSPTPSTGSPASSRCRCTRQRADSTTSSSRSIPSLTGTAATAAR